MKKVIYFIFTIVLLTACVDNLDDYNVDQKRAALQVALLRKALDSQEQQAAEILKLVEGKGQQLDIRDVTAVALAVGRELDPEDGRRARRDQLRVEQVD